jgi:hypothetical protein
MRKWKRVKLDDEEEVGKIGYEETITRMRKWTWF